MNNTKKGFPFILPSFLGMSLFYLMPILIMIYFSMTVNGTFDQFNGIQTLLKSQIFLQAMTNTLLFTLVGVTGLVVLSIVFTLVIDKMTILKGVIKTCILSPLVIPTASIIMIWQLFFDNGGVMNHLLSSLNISTIDFFNSSWSFLNVLLLFFWKNLGYMILILTAAVENVDVYQYEAAGLDGASELQKAWYITIPNIRHAIIFVVVISMVNAFKAFREIYLLLGQYPHQSVYSLQHYMNNLFQVMDYQKLSIIALVVFIIVLTIVLFILRLERKAS